MGNNIIALMLSIWVKKKKSPLLLFKVIFSFYFPAMSDIEMYHPSSLLARQDWSTDTCRTAKMSPRRGAKCVFSRKRKKENKNHCDGALNTEWKPCWMSRMMHGHHNFTRAHCTFHCLGQNGPSWARVRSYETMIYHRCHTTDLTSCQWATWASFVNRFTTTHWSGPART